MPVVVEVAGQLCVAVAEDCFAEPVPKGKSAPKGIEQPKEAQLAHIIPLFYNKLTI
jgi:hypothetical protein